MIKKVTLILLFLMFFLAVGFLSFYYYIKPQREFIKTSSERCINESMAPINNETAKYSPNPYKTRQGFEIMLKTQSDELNKCLANYDTILFSKPEKNLFLLNLDSTVKSQKSKIDEYANRINIRIDEGNKQQAKKQACANMKAEQEKQSICMQERFPDPGMDREKYNLALSQMDEKAKICEAKYDYTKFGVDYSDCLMMDIFNY